ncbi:hypothetical protein [Grimontia marina]|uniref:Lipoprotein n=1 Tax=Grimontia marina TaxID=646534 RepID=A0A128F317_9GAMM|nr:hypothetical protein [Grimontia marina]CZF80636.1 hypothetical protein GMA8713_01532 [Grimontia marina]
MKLIAIMFLTLFFASGCKITSIEGETKDVEIKVNSKEDENSGHSEGKFCPPGQAKKGRC